MPVRIEQMEIPFAPRSILRLFGLESQIVEASPERVHIRHMEDQPTPAVDRLTLLQIENGRLPPLREVTRRTLLLRRRAPPCRAHPDRTAPRPSCSRPETSPPKFSPP